MILKCDCEHKSQDKLHGKKMRVYNEGNTNGTTKVYRCTVCSKEVRR